MPVRRSAVSLKVVAITVLGKHFELICYGCRNKQQISQLWEMGENAPEAEVLRYLPGHLLEEVYSVLCSRKCNSYYLNALIQPQIRSCKVELGSFHHAMEYLQKRCPRLSSLQLCGFRDTKPELFINIWSSFPHLVSINLSKTILFDAPLNVIGANCHKLREINLSGTTVSDTGLKFICVSEARVPRCQELISINLQDTKYISRSGVGSFAFFHPQIRKIEYRDTIGALSFLVQQGVTQPLYNITGLTASSREGVIQDLDIALQVNPNFKTLEIKNTDLRSENLYPVMTSQFLSELHISNSDEFLIEFDLGIVPILSTTGNTLKKISLDRFQYVDIGVIGETCTNITHLVLAHILSFPPLLNLDSGCYNQLQELQILNSYGAAISQNLYRQLLFYCHKIEEICLQFAQQMDDELWSDILCSNPMSLLESVAFDQCHSISFYTIEGLLLHDNRLESVSCLSCRNIDREDWNRLKASARDNNYDLCLRMYPFCGEGLAPASLPQNQPALDL